MVADAAMSILCDAVSFYLNVVSYVGYAAVVADPGGYADGCFGAARSRRSRRTIRDAFPTGRSRQKLTPKPPFIARMKFAQRMPVITENNYLVTSRIVFLVQLFSDVH